MHNIKLNCKYLQPCLDTLAKLVSMATYQEMYQTGCQLNHDGIKNIALHFLMYKIEELKKTKFFLNLPESDLQKILQSSLLNVKNEFSVVEIILSWICHNQISESKMETVSGNLLCHVRWSRISSAELDSLLRNDAVLNDMHIKMQINKLTSTAFKEEAREWPKLLMIVEHPPNRPKLGESEVSLVSRCTVQCYASDSKQWSRITEVPGTEEGIWGSGYSAVSIENNLVLTIAASKVRYLPLAVHTYDIWSDTWSKRPSLCYKDKSPDAAWHVTTTTKNQLFTVLHPKNNPDSNPIPLCLHRGSNLQTGNPTWSVNVCPNLAANALPGPPDVSTNEASNQSKPIIYPSTVVASDDDVHVIGFNGRSHGKLPLNLDTFHLTSQTWSHATLGLSEPRDILSGWLCWKNKLLRIGGACPKTGKSLATCSAFPCTGGKATEMASLVRERAYPSITEFKGMLFAAGGYRFRSIGRMKTDVKMIVEASVEYYVPELDSWNLMRTQPKLSFGTVTLLVVDKPIRLLGSLTFPTRRGVKRPLVE